MVKEKKKQPVLFSGVKYYEQLMHAMHLTMEANVEGDLLRWVNLLSQLSNWVVGFCDVKEIQEQLRKLRVEAVGLASYGITRDAMLKQKILMKHQELVQKINDVETLLYKEMEPLLLRVGGDSLDDVDMDEMFREME